MHPTAHGCCAVCFPEVNFLVPLDGTADFSNAARGAADRPAAWVTVL
ncbi:hypothetical protein M2161_008984 [Streptomyces sp. SAI-133]|nr:hypothetical protein [Streptomyces sp. SAI-133]MDH6589878.1 hypothetical protein [Streptomyces sp. SAI-133]